MKNAKCQMTNDERSSKSEVRSRNSEFGILSSFDIRHSSFRRQRGSTFIIVLWIAFGLVGLALYFASSMSFELHASDNRTSGLQADMAIDGASRYVQYVLGSQLTNGMVPDPTTYLSEAVPIGDGHFWLIGRSSDDSTNATSFQMTFQLVDEASKINLNYATSNMLAALPTPPMTQDLLMGILDWRGTNGGNYESYYGSQRPAYTTKKSPFETVGELRMVYGATMDALVAEDLNANGALDPNETDDDHNGMVTPGVMEYFTVYTREPNTNNDGAARINVSTLAAVSTPGSPMEQFITMLRTNLSAQTVAAVLSSITGPPGQRTPPPPVVSRSPLEFYMNFHRAPANLSASDFALIEDKITFTNGAYINGRININTAGQTVLACLPGISDDPSLAQTLISYRQSNSDKLGSVAWVVDALGTSNAKTMAALSAKDCITTRSYQFTADIAALGPHGRGYRRAKFIFDTAEGTPKIVYRQDLSNLGWALGKDVRQTWVTEKSVAAQ
jgi:type II secretory pathway component PulK